MFGNVAGLYPQTNKVKVQYLGEIAEESDSIIIALSESHLKSQILDAEISIPGFQLFRADRQDHINKGGVITYVKDEYASGLQTLTSGCNEAVEWNCLFLPVIQSVIVNIYRPPSCTEPKFNEMLTDISAAIEKMSAPMPNLIMCGDFNLPIIDWGTGKISGGTHDLQKQAEALMEFMSAHCLQQMISEPTRMNNILDLFLTNNPEIVTNVKISNTVISDHRLITVDTCIEKSESHRRKREKLKGFASLNFNHKRIDWAKLNQELQMINWEEQLQSKLEDDTLSIIYEKLLSACQKHIPKKGELVRKSIIPRDRRILMRNRANVNRQLRKGNSNRRETLIRKLENIEYKLLESHKRQEKAKELRAVNTIKENSKYFFAYAKDKAQIRTQIGPLEKDGLIVENPLEVSQILQDQFTSVFSKPKFSQTDPYNLGVINQSFCDIEIQIEDIEEAINKLSRNSSPGPDGVPSVLLKECVHSLKYPLCMLWRKSMLSGHIPDRLKIGQITPVHKSGSRNEARNYRPITLT